MIFVFLGGLWVSSFTKQDKRSGTLKKYTPSTINTEYASYHKLRQGQTSDRDQSVQSTISSRVERHEVDPLSLVQSRPVFTLRQNAVSLENAFEHRDFKRPPSVAAPTTLSASQPSSGVLAIGAIVAASFLSSLSPGKNKFYYYCGFFIAHAACPPM